MLSSLGLGGLSIIFSSAGSIPRAMAGSPSVTRFISRSWMGISTTGNPKIIAESIVKTSPMLQANIYLTNFRIFEYMVLPCSTALTRVAKLSSKSTNFAASLVTSVPVLPIATPIAASFTAGASLTPSPVIATIFPWDFMAFTMRSLSAGLTLANTEAVFTASLSSLSLIKDISAPVKAFPPLFIIPACLAMFIAVFLWSPVSIIIRIPAFSHFFTAAFISGRSGSSIPWSPTKTKELSGVFL